MWAKIKCKKGFFIPTIAIYLIFLFSFVVFQVIQIVDYQVITMNQRKQLELYYIREQAIKWVEQDLKKQYPQYCIVPTIYTSKTYGEGTVKVKRSCIRQEPDLKYRKQLKDYENMRPLYKLLNMGPNNVSNINYEAKQLILMALVTMQIDKEWVGLPFDIGDISLEAAAKQKILKKVPFWLIYMLDIDYQGQRHEMMLITNPKNDKVEQVFFT